ncbi:MAG TPA: hypothetical protein VM425_09475 [Myxococcota bacterium]|nr:hypothetical protein [Myxococcota bacterium]
MKHYGLIVLFLLALVIPAGCGSSGGDQDAGYDAGQDAGGDAKPDGADVDNDGGGDQNLDGGGDQMTDGGGDQGPLDCNEVVCDEECAVYVDLAGPGGDGSTPETALYGVQAGIDAAAALAGECCRCAVRVAEGSYFVYRDDGRNSIRLHERVDVYGGYPHGFADARDIAMHPSVLDGRDVPEGEAHVYHVVTGCDDSRLDGMVITAGQALFDDNDFNPDNYGGGMINLGVSPTVSGCVFRGNEARHGGGLYSLESSSEMSSCRFEHNTATVFGGGLDMRQGRLAILDTTFISNAADYGAGAHNGAGSDARYANCVFAGNAAVTSGGGLHNDGAVVQITNCTLSGNTAGTSGGAMANVAEAQITAANSIFYGDAPDEIFNETGVVSSVTYSDVQGGCSVAGGCTDDETGNLDLDPVFVGADHGDLRLWIESPLIDQGENSLVPVDLLTDYEGEERITDGDGDDQAVVDMGADEMARRLEDFKVIYVNASAHGAYDGTSWPDALDDLQDALAMATPFTQIWVAAGSYFPSQLGDKVDSFTLSPGVAVYGGFDPAQGADSLATRDSQAYETILSGDIMHDDDLTDGNQNNSYHVVTSGTPSIFDGFTITAGYNHVMTSGDNYYAGTGLLVLDDHFIWVRDCKFTLGDASFGGAVLIQPGASPVFENCTFKDNIARGNGGYGGAVYAYSPGVGAAFRGCKFIDNTAGSNGGAIYTNGSLEISECEFRGNQVIDTYSTRSGGGAMYVTSSAAPLITDCLFAENGAGNGGALLVDYSSVPVISGCTFENNVVFDDQQIGNCVPDFGFLEGTGGAILSIDSTLTISDSSFTGNSATFTGNAACFNQPYNSYYGVGGAIFNDGGSAYIKNTSFENNAARINGIGQYAGSGGALANKGAHVWVANCLFKDNSATRTVANGLFTYADGSGGAVWNLSLPNSGNPATEGAAFANCLFMNNSASCQGGGMYASWVHDAWLYGCTFVGNSSGSPHFGGGALSNYSQLNVYNSIFWGNTGWGQATQICGLGDSCSSNNKVSTYYTTIQSGCATGCTCNNLSTTDPAFDSDGIHLTSGSPCRNTGNNGNRPADWLDVDGNGDTSESIPLDLDGNPRTVGTVDRGAYEVQ